MNNNNNKYKKMSPCNEARANNQLVIFLYPALHWWLWSKNKSKFKKLESKQMQIAAVTKNNKALNANDKMKCLNTSSN